METYRNLDETPQVPLEGDSRVKSPTRMRYEAEVLFLKNQNGNLDHIRQKLGLSRRKICQLLLVDPSAWTRWTAPEGEAPPHIYRALDWYLSIMEKDPEYRRLSQRFSLWLNHEKDHEGRLASLERLLRVGRDQVSWRDFAGPVLAFAGGSLMTLVLLKVL